MTQNLVEKYQDSNIYTNSDSNVFQKGDYVIERQPKGLYGHLRIARYYSQYEKFGIIVDEEMHNELFDAIRDIKTAQLDRTIKKFESSDNAYFWTFVKDRLGEVWLSEEDIKKREEIVDKLRELSDL